MNTADYRHYKLHPELTAGFALEKAPEDSPDEERFLATVTCTKCPEMWDVHIPLQKGAFNVLRQHYTNRHAPITEWQGEIRRKSFRSRFERKLDNVLSCVSYLPGLRPVDASGGRTLSFSSSHSRSGRLLLEEEVQDAGHDASDHGRQEALPIEVRNRACDGGS